MDISFGLNDKEKEFIRKFTASNSLYLTPGEYMFHLERYRSEKNQQSKEALVSYLERLHVDWYKSKRHDAMKQIRDNADDIRKSYNDNVDLNNDSLHNKTLDERIAYVKSIRRQAAKMIFHYSRKLLSNLEQRCYDSAKEIYFDYSTWLEILEEDKKVKPKKPKPEDTTLGKALIAFYNGEVVTREEHGKTLYIEHNKVLNNYLRLCTKESDLVKQNRIDLIVALMPFILPGTKKLKAKADIIAIKSSISKNSNPL